MEPSSRGRHVCPVCAAEFTLNASLKSHMQKLSHLSNPIPKSDESDSGISSDFLETTYLKQQKAAQKIEQHLADQSILFRIAEVKSSSHPELFSSLPTSPSESFCKCMECNKIFDSQEKLAQHQRSKNHEGKETIVCPSSNDDVKVITKLETVSSVSNVRTFTCASCARSFDSSEKLAQHNTSEGHLAKLKEKSPRFAEISHHGNEPTLYFCKYPECGKVFNDRYKLNQHQLMKNHLVVLQSVGPTVDEKLNTFPKQETTIEVENKLHTYDSDYSTLLTTMKGGNDFEKHFVATKSIDYATSTNSCRKLCDQCEEFNEASQSKNFIFLTFVAKHYLKKHAPANYVRGYCPICNQKMEKTKNLLVHIARVHLFPRFKDEACLICLRLCKDANDLQEHTSSVHRYKCLMDECSSMFASKALRDKHMNQKHGVHVCSREDCNSIFTSVEEKLRHVIKPHPVQNDSDSGLSSAYSSEAVGYRSEFERGAYSEPTGTYHQRNERNQYPYSADELSCASLPTNTQTSTQNAAFKLFKNHMQFLKTALKELKEPLKEPVNPLCANEALHLCNEVMDDLSEIRDHYRRSPRNPFDIDLISQ